MADESKGRGHFRFWLGMIAAAVTTPVLGSIYMLALSGRSVRYADQGYLSKDLGLLIWAYVPWSILLFSICASLIALAHVFIRGMSARSVLGGSALLGFVLSILFSAAAISPENPLDIVLMHFPALSAVFVLLFVIVALVFCLVAGVAWRRQSTISSSR